MDGRNASKHRRMTHDFAFSGLIACGRCGCSVVGEIKKQKYIYYHCTGYADKCQGKPASCRRKYVREEVLEKQFTAMLGQLRFDDEVLEWVRAALHASHADERHEHEEAIKRLQAEHWRLGERISTMYIDKLDGKIGGDFFDKMAGQWREDQRRLQQDIDRHEEAEQSYMDEGVQILELARNAQALFERQPAREKRRLLNFVLSNCSWEDGEVVATFRQPFDILAETTAIAARSSAGSGLNSSKNEIWLAGYFWNRWPDRSGIRTRRRWSPASYMESAADWPPPITRLPRKPKVAQFCAAPWPIFTPPLTGIRGFARQDRAEPVPPAPKGRLG